MVYVRATHIAIWYWALLVPFFTLSSWLLVSYSFSFHCFTTWTINKNKFSHYSDRSLLQLNDTAHFSLGKVCFLPQSDNFDSMDSGLLHISLPFAFLSFSLSLYLSLSPTLTLEHILQFIFVICLTNINSLYCLLLAFHCASVDVVIEDEVIKTFFWNNGQDRLTNWINSHANHVRSTKYL